jgi:DNA-binding winged helix-turn-helix (wHTH) protein/tetratricopeptide (TPR) repeat protein
MVDEARSPLVRFGPFELDLRSAELYNDGRKVPLQEQPFQILQLLIGSPGDLVTREEIRRRLWPDDTTVEFENAINAAIKKLRIALGDSVDEPRYVETVKRRGYRLIMPVERSPAVPATPLPASQEEEHDSTAGRVLETAAVSSTPALEIPPIRSASPPAQWKLIASAAILIAICVSGYLYLHKSAPDRAKLRNKDKIVLADFLNKTGDPVFDDTLRQGLRVQLEQSPFLTLVSDERMQQALHLMGQPQNAPLTWETARQICERTGSAAVVDGSVATLGTRYVLGLRARDCRTGEAVAEEQLQAADKEDVLNALGLIAIKLRTRVGESSKSVEMYATPLAETTTASLDALKAYSEGFKVLSSSGSSAALHFFKHATEIDPNFAVAYAHTGLIYDSMGESDLATASIAKAYGLLSRVSEAEKFFISALYQQQVTGNLEKEQQICEAWTQTYPQAMEPHGLLSGGVYPVLGRYDKAGEHGTRTIELDPEFVIGYNILALSYIERDRLGKAEDVLRQATDRKLELPDFFVDRFEIAFLKNDAAAMEREVTLSQGVSGAEDLIADEASFSLAYAGHLQQANRRSKTAVLMAQQSGQTERAALFETGVALREAFSGNAPAARESAESALKLSKDREVEYGAAFVLALAGDSFHAQMHADNLEKQYPEDTSVLFSYLPAVKALLALNRKDPTKAIELLQTAAPHELGTPPSADFGYYGALYPIYVRGLAYLAAKRGAEAASEFQNIINHRGVVVTDPIGALAHLQLARAFASSGDKTRAKAAYQDFLTLWKDADSDIPILKEAQSEYADLE